MPFLFESSGVPSLASKGGPIATNSCATDVLKQESVYGHSSTYLGTYQALRSQVSSVCLTRHSNPQQTAPHLRGQKKIGVEAGSFRQKPHAVLSSQL